MLPSGAHSWQLELGLHCTAQTEMKRLRSSWVEATMNSESNLEVNTNKSLTYPVAILPPERQESYKKPAVALVVFLPDTASPP